MKNLSSEILFVTHKYPPSIGGMQRQSYELISEISKKTKTHAILFKSNYPKVVFLFLAIPRIWLKLMTNPNIRLIHANDGLMAIFLTPFLIRRNTKLVATIHGLDIVFSFRLYQFWIKRLLSKFDLIVAVSEGTKEECIKRGISKEKIVFIPNGFELPTKEVKSKKQDHSWKSQLDDSIILLSVGRPVPRKGFSWFVKNVLPLIEVKCTYLLVGPKLNNEGRLTFFQRYLPNWLFKKYCILNGIPLDYIELKKLSGLKHGKCSIALVGQLSQTELEKLYSEADLFLMPNIHVESDYEGFGLVTLEATARGLLCLASKVDGIPSAIQHKETGLLLEPENAMAWSKKINELLNEKNYKEAGETFRKNLLINNHSWENMSKAYLEAFKAFGI